MFDKLLSNLPFNPSLIDQVSFYAKRLRRESSVRRLGFVFVMLVMAVQLVAVLSPPQYSLATSPNDIIYGGAPSTTDLTNDYNNNSGGDLQNILHYYGVGPDQLKQAQSTTIDSRGANANHYYAAGRTNTGGSDDYQVPVPSTTTPIYMGTLGSLKQQVWDAYKVPSTTLGHVYILKSCGGVVTEGPPPVGKPALNLTKTATPGNGSSVHPGDHITYDLVFSNTGQAPATNFKITDTVPSQVTSLQALASDATGSIQGQTYTAVWSKPPQPSTLGPSTNLSYQAKFSGTVRSDAKPGSFCNVATASADGTSVTSNQVCHTIPACPYNAAITDTDAACKPPVPPVAACTILNATYLSRTKVQFEARAQTSGGATMSAFNFDSGSGKTETIKLSSATGNISKTFTFDYPDTPASYKANVTAVTSVGNKTAATCAQPITIVKAKTPLVTVSKAVYTSSPGQSSSQISANPGQSFGYVFTISNVGDADAEHYALPQDTINDTLEYADVVNAGDAQVAQQGNTTVLEWAPLTVKAGQTITKTVTFRMKDPLPTTNTPPGNPESFDCKIQNSIASSTAIVTIDQTNCLPKVVEQTATVLPNTGPGSSLLIVFAMVAIVGYFFARSRLMARELEIVKAEYTTGGGV